MDDAACVKIWMGSDIPARFRQLDGLRHFVSQGEGEAIEYRGVIVVFVAHVPASVSASPVYRMANWPTEIAGWLRDGEGGLFGTNALAVIPHPNGDGVLLVGTAV